MLTRYQFQALDRQTDATLVLMAAPSHSTKMHMLTSRSIKRSPDLGTSPALAPMRSGFRHLAARRRATRPRGLSSGLPGSPQGSQGSGGAASKKVAR